MKTFTIRSHINGKTLYEGVFPSFRASLEQAVIDKADLSVGDFKNLNLANACLDDGIFAEADFSGANLTGVNLSESCLENANLQDTDLYNTCMAYSNLRGCNFSGAAFGATDITGSDLDQCRFSTLSCFSLDFISASSMNNCRFENIEKNSFIMSRPPIVVRGIGKKLIVLTEEAWMHGTAILSYPEQFRPGFFQPHKTSGMPV